MITVLIIFLIIVAVLFGAALFLALDSIKAAEQFKSDRKISKHSN